MVYIWASLCVCLCVECICSWLRQCSMALITLAFISTYYFLSYLSYKYVYINSFLLNVIHKAIAHGRTETVWFECALYISCRVMMTAAIFSSLSSFLFVCWCCCCHSIISISFSLSWHFNILLFIFFIVVFPSTNINRNRNSP